MKNYEFCIMMIKLLFEIYSVKLLEERFYIFKGYLLFLRRCVFLGNFVVVVVNSEEFLSIFVLCIDFG